MRLRNLTAWLAGGAIIVALGSALVALEARSESVVSDNMDRYALAGGVLRMGSDGVWDWHTAGHAAENERRVTCDSRGILHARIAQGDTPVGFGSVDVDETLMLNGITAGASVARGDIRVFFERSGKRLSCRSRLFRDDRSNVWVLWMVPREPRIDAR
jgi:hypothetical protein